MGSSSVVRIIELRKTQLACAVEQGTGAGSPKMTWAITRARTRHIHQGIIMSLRVPPPPPPRRTGGTDWKSAIEREHKKGIEDVLHIAEESKEEGLAQALGKFMKANGDACKALTP